MSCTGSDIVDPQGLTVIDLEAAHLTPDSVGPQYAVQIVRNRVAGIGPDEVEQRRGGREMKVKAGGIHEERVIRKIVGSGNHIIIIRCVADNGVVVEIKDT